MSDLCEGDRFGRLTFLRETAPGKGGRRFGAFRCDCSQIVERMISRVRRGEVKGCGCLRGRDKKHGAAVHGSLTPEYYSWVAMKARCLNPNVKNWPRYGGRGITVCDRWAASFSAFLKDMGTRPTAKYTLDRIDNDKNYEPGNVRWATPKEQQRNRARTSLIEIDGRSVPLSQACEERGLNLETVRHRLRAGYPAQRALSTNSFRGRSCG